MSKVTITYYDNESLTVEEIVAQTHHNYGKQAHVDIAPDSSIAYDYIYFGLQQLITQEQISLYYAKNNNYNFDLQKLREKVIIKITEIIDQVIIDNESKVG